MSFSGGVSDGLGVAAGVSTEGVEAATGVDDSGDCAAVSDVDGRGCAPSALVVSCMDTVIPESNGRASLAQAMCKQVAHFYLARGDGQSVFLAL